MFRRYSINSTIIEPTWSKGHLSGRYFAGFIFGILGTLYYTRRTIYADYTANDTHQENKVHVDPRNGSLHRNGSVSHHDEMPDRWEDPYYYDKIRRCSATGTIQGKSGISRVDAAAVPNYIPRRDACALSSVKLNTGTSWTFFGLFDGYNGWHNKDYIAPNLIPALLDALANLASTHQLPSTEHVEIGMSPPHDPETSSEEYFSDAMDRKIKEIFLNVDNAVVHQGVDSIFSSSSKTAAVRPRSLALSGTSALISFYDLETRLLKIALAGNSRGVLGRRVQKNDGNQKFSYYEVHVLTPDQTSENSSELAAHARSGSNESNLTRAFGLAAYKWSREIQERMHREYLGDPPTPNIKIYPHLTAEPVVTTIEVKPGDFLIMSSAGLWNSITNEEAVGLVGLWLDRGMYQAEERYSVPTATSTQPVSTPPSAQIIHPTDLPVSLGAKDETVMYQKWRAEKRFVCVDINAAGHLARNALGGANGDLTNALLSAEPPLSNNLRDDINTAVIFFDG